MIELHVNGKGKSVDVASDTPLLWVLRDNLGITSVKYTCGVGECGVCTVLIDGESVRSCSITAKEAAGRKILTIEGIPDDHPVKIGWLEKQVPQCGYCQPGIMLQAVDFLTRNPTPTDTQINEAMDDVICRCGSHPRIKKAIRFAAEMTTKQGG
ncbi:(2Fe-2S)-binding protein [Desulforhopalus singaporensis]|uniref:Isoquinoline 1-oxidoreductase, alpha subunit n=1 Tax=Desulforhopalus singaporensis TaxID=91360 RepID=A0A1H0T7L9_9BACT|nr:(2Fe-2S)-binding protein [Desulforhopalus singaporensis]SDP49710.1 isoquinoline 1-oxidoreductase, alpha subunit [Desulforhopalus singaporensis]